MENYAIMVKNNSELSKYADQWVALSSETHEIIAYAPTPKRALEEARKKGELDPILTRVPKRFDSYVL